MTKVAHLRSMAFALALVTAASSVATSQKTPDAQLQEAVNTELVAGDLPRAIALYKAFVKANPAHRRLAAQALANLGRSYEKLGATEARAAYEQLVRDYSDQAAPLAFARTRLSAIGSTNVAAGEGGDRGVQSMMYPDLPSFRTRESPQYDLSPDGQRLVLRIPSENVDSLLGPSLAIATAGGAVLHTIVAPARQTGRNSPRWSPDGKHIAYIERAFIDSDTTFAKLMIVPAQGGSPRVVTDSLDFPGGVAVGGLLWTPDSRALTLATTRHVTTYDLDGKVLRSVPFRLPYLGQFTSYSPDGRWLALHQQDPGSEQPENANVWIMPASGGRAISSRARRALMAGPPGHTMGAVCTTLRSGATTRACTASASTRKREHRRVNPCASFPTRTRRSSIRGSSAAGSGLPLRWLARRASSERHRWTPHRRIAR